MNPLLNKETKIRVSSVLNKDTRSYGKQFLVDGNEETCWNSDQGDDQWIHMNFNHDILIKRIEIRFQGGFSCSMCKIEKLNNSNESTLIKEIFPEDNNSNQIFDLNENTEIGNNYRLTFVKNTDFFGRLIIYNLQFYGNILE